MLPNVTAIDVEGPFRNRYVRAELATWSDDHPTKTVALYRSLSADALPSMIMPLERYQWSIERKQVLTEVEFDELFTKKQQLQRPVFGQNKKEEPPEELVKKCVEINGSWLNSRGYGILVYLNDTEVDTDWRFRIYAKETHEVLCEHLSTEISGHTAYLIAEAVKDGIIAGIKEGRMRAVAELFTNQCELLRLDPEQVLQRQSRDNKTIMQKLYTSR